jgi:hypothetical protein
MPNRAKKGRNRMHLDLRAADQAVEAVEADRQIALGR